jgi:hypothetical protein
MGRRSDVPVVPTFGSSGSSLAGVFAIIVALPLTLSCRQILGIGPRPVHQADGGASEPIELMICGLPTSGPTAACGQCMNDACCTQAGVCAESQDCPKLEACVRACAAGDAVCRAGCYAGPGTPSQTQQVLEDCRATYCADACSSGPWECLGQVTWSRQSSTGSTPQNMTINTAVDDESNIPISGATVRVCSLVDPMCLVPLTSGQTDDTGVAALVVDTAKYVPPLALFLDYHKEGFQDLLVLFNTPPLVQAPFFVTSGRSDFDGVAIALHADGHWSDASTGTTYDPTRAQVLVLVRDCNDLPAGNSQPLRGLLTVTWPDRDAQTRTAVDAANGSALAVNLPVNPAAGITRVVVFEAASLRFIGTASLAVRPNTLTVTSLVPTP